MKRILFLTLSAVVLLTACSKDEDAKKDDSVTINGDSYPTTKIGSQSWTTVNYNGPGGTNYNNGNNDPSLGKLYSFVDVRTLSGLPTGWRVPTEVDVAKLIEHIGSETDGRGKKFLNEVNSKKLTATSGWEPAGLNGSNSTGLNIRPTGYYFSATTANFESKGTSGSLWTISKDQLGQALFFEVSYSMWEEPSNTFSLRGSLVGTTLTGETNGSFVEKRPIRFVKDN